MGLNQLKFRTEESGISALPEAEWHHREHGWV